jgi:hypothetical protein
VGESKIQQKDFLFALLVSAVGDRPLGLQVSQLAAVARWLNLERKVGPVSIVAHGNRASLAALAAAGLETQSVSSVQLHDSLGSLKQIIEESRTVNKEPELFTFGLLAEFDIKQLAALAAPRPVKLVEPSDRAKAELADLNQWYGVFGKEVKVVD